MTNVHPTESPVQVSTPLGVGDLAPDFTLVDQYGVDVSLSAVRGLRNAVIVFYPAAFSGICRGELREIRDGLEDFQDGDIQVFTISCDSMYTLRAWADAEDGFALRGTFLIDRSGRIVWTEVRGIGSGRDFRAYREALAALRASQRDAVG